MNNLLQRIDKVLFASAKKMSNPEINKDLGVLIYFATRYNSSGEEEHKKKSLYLLNNLISVFGDHDFSTGVIEGFEGVFHTVEYLKKCNIIDDSREFLEEIEENLFQSIENDIDDTMFDVFYGSIGKIQYFLNEERIQEEKVIELINQLIDSLWESKTEENGQYFWIDKFTNDPKLELIDLGLAHGLCAILLFLLRLKELKFNNPHLDPLIYGVIETFKRAENKEKGTSFFPDRYSIKNSHLNLINSRLAYCVGDLPITYAFCYAAQVMKDNELLEYSKQIIKISTYKEVSSSHLKQFKENDFFDIGFCHGIGSILYLFHKINKYHQDDFINFKTDYWKQELIVNINKLIKIKDPIYYPKLYNQVEDKVELNKYSFLNGLCGAALALLALEYDETGWSSFLCIY
jgi:hypothetical protein